MEEEPTDLLQVTDNLPMTKPTSLSKFFCLLWEVSRLDAGRVFRLGSAALRCRVILWSIHHFGIVNAEAREVSHCVFKIFDG